MWNRGNPTRDDWYLVTTENGSVTMAYWMDNKFRDFDDMFVAVIAWQELPAPADEEFKSGDRIRCIADHELLELGKVYTFKEYHFVGMMHLFILEKYPDSLAFPSKLFKRSNYGN